MFLHLSIIFSFSFIPFLTPTPKTPPVVTNSSGPSLFTIALYILNEMADSFRNRFSLLGSPTHLADPQQHIKFTPVGTSRPMDLDPKVIKRYFQILQSIHHTEILEESIRTGIPPKGMARKIAQLTAFIKPAAPDDHHYPYLPDKGNDERYSRLLSLNRWLARYSSEQGFGFIDNWPSLWGRPGVLMRDGLHPTGLGASIMSKNIDRCLSQA